jgi:hypothetical protein
MHVFDEGRPSMGNQTKTRSRRRPLTHEDLEREPNAQLDSGGNGLNGILLKASLKDVSLKERRKEARKPLYLMRYE